MEFASSFLETNGWDLDLCVNLYLEGGGQAQHAAAAQSHPRSEEFDFPTEHAQYVEPEVRAPIMPKHEVLVEEDPYEAYQRRRQHKTGFHNNTPKGVFEMFRDFNQEGAKAPKRTDIPETESQKKLKTLADLFRPPVELIEPGSFEDVKQKALMRNKWLLVNIQTITEFDCQRLNRDTWSDAALKSMVAESFVLWQVLRESEEGGRYCRFYPVNILPHIAIVDSRTGERLVILEGFIEASALKAELVKFTETHAFDESETVKVAPSQPKRKGDMSEEEQLMAAIAASLGPRSEQPESEPRREVQAPPAHVFVAPAPGPESIPQAVAEPEPIIAPATIHTPIHTTPAPVPSALEAIDPTIKDRHSNPSAEFTCTIQIRLPSGQSPIKGHFRPADTLSLVHKYTALYLEPGASFTLFSTFPKRSFTGDALSQTLQQADLVPRAVLNCERN